MTDDFKLVSNNIFLRDMISDDIDDYIDWYTRETEWQKWDAPWEFEQNIDIMKFREGLINKLNKPLPHIRRKLQICYKDGVHIGSVNSYFIDDNKKMLAVGIDIPAIKDRGKGLGQEALTLFISYLLNSKISEDIYTETWSGNERMIKLALKCCFEGYDREKDFKIIDGRYYDGLTFKLNKDKFWNKYKSLH